MQAAGKKANLIMEFMCVELVDVVSVLRDYNAVFQAMDHRHDFALILYSLLIHVVYLMGHGPEKRPRLLIKYRPKVSAV